MLVDKIPNSLLIQYMNWQINSSELAAQTGFHPASIRRAIKRPQKAGRERNKTRIINVRKAFRKSIAHLPAKEIAVQANVSLATANRIRKTYGTVKRREANVDKIIEEIYKPYTDTLPPAPKPAPKKPTPVEEPEIEKNLFPQAVEPKPKLPKKTPKKQEPPSPMTKLAQLANNPKDLENIDIDAFFNEIGDAPLVSGLQDLSLNKGE